MTRLAAAKALIACLAALTAALAFGPIDSAPALTLGQCEGASITAEGGGLQALAEGTWTKEFNISTTAAACNGEQGSKGTPTVTYKGTSGSAALKAWAANEEYAQFPFISKGFPPNVATIKKLENVAKFPGRANTLLTIPVAQTAIAVIVHLPTGCTATSTPASGRLVMTNVTLEAVMRGAVTAWSAIKDSGDALSGGSCNAATPIKRVVPKEAADPEAIVKKYLFQVNSAKVWKGTKTWTQIAEVTKWPEEEADPISRQLNVAAYVAEHPSTIGIAWVHPARSSFGAPGHGANTASFWVDVQDNGVSTEAPTYADPANNGDLEENGNSNCRETVYANAGKELPTPLESWNAITAETTEVHYTLCGLSYVFALNKYSAYSGATFPPTEAEARTVRDYLSFVVDIEPAGGQPIIGTFGTDYGKLQPDVFNEVHPYVGTIDY